jgi:hypothetical protein
MINTAICQNPHAKHLDNVIRRSHAQEHSSNLIVHQPNTTLHENQVFNLSGSMAHGGIKQPISSIQPGFTQKQKD